MLRQNTGNRGGWGKISPQIRTHLIITQYLLEIKIKIINKEQKTKKEKEHGKERRTATERRSVGKGKAPELDGELGQGSGKTAQNTSVMAKSRRRSQHRE
jgi:hypothetical protein